MKEGIFNRFYDTENAENWEESESEVLRALLAAGVFLALLLTLVLIIKKIFSFIFRCFLIFSKLKEFAQKNLIPPSDACFLIETFILQRKISDYATEPANPRIELLPANYYIRKLEMSQNFEWWFPNITEAITGRKFSYPNILKAIINSANDPNHIYIRALQDPENQTKISNSLEFKLFTMKLLLPRPTLSKRFLQSQRQLMLWQPILSPQDLSQFLKYWQRKDHYLLYPNSNITMKYMIYNGPFRLLPKKDYLLQLAENGDIQEFFYQIGNMDAGKIF